MKNPATTTIRARVESHFGNRDGKLSRDEIKATIAAGKGDAKAL